MTASFQSNRAAGSALQMALGAHPAEPDRGRSCCRCRHPWACRALPAFCLDEALDELVDVALLGKVPLGQQVAQFGLGQAFVALAGPCVSLPGVLALGLAG